MSAQDNQQPTENQPQGPPPPDSLGPKIRVRGLAHDRDGLFRVTLANQRTFLAYLRTALTMFVAGVTFIRFFDSLLLEVVGWVFVPLAVATLVIGVYRYNSLRVRMKRTRKTLYDRHSRTDT